jgi:2-dehydropantoate 2-reductase
MSAVEFDKIFILGAGAIGSVIGALLSKQNDVTLIGNEAHVEAANSSGLSISGDFNKTFRVRADTRIREIPQRTLIFLTTKAYDSEKAMSGVRRLLREDTVIFVLQNGLGNEETVKRVVGGRVKVLRGITTMAGEFFRPGEVTYWKGEITIEHDAVAEKIAEILNASNVTSSVVEDIRDKVWGKVVVNSVVNPLTAIFRVRNREIGTKSLATVRHCVIRECVQVGKTEGITFPEHLEQEIDREILNYTNFSSMCQDLMKGKKTEIDFLNGKIVELGRKHNVPTPVNETLVCFIKFLEEKNELPRKD